jgi:hypothetical protein
LLCFFFVKQNKIKRRQPKEQRNNVMLRREATITAIAYCSDSKPVPPMSNGPKKFAKFP